MPMNPIRILTMIELDPAEVKQIQEGSPVAVEVVQVKNREEFRKALPEAEVVYGGVTGADLDYAPMPLVNVLDKARILAGINQFI